MMRRRNPNINDLSRRNSTRLSPIFFPSPAPPPEMATNSLSYNALGSQLIIDFAPPGE